MDTLYVIIEVVTNVFMVTGGTASGFYSTEEEEMTPRLYLLGNTKKVHLEPVLLHAGSLDQGRVYILVTSKTIYVWCGTKVICSYCSDCSHRLTVSNLWSLSLTYI